MTKLIDHTTISLAKQAKNKSFRLFSSYVFLVLFVISVYMIISFNKVTLNDYTYVNSSDVMEYKPYNVGGQIYTDAIYAEDSKLGIAVFFEEEQSGKFVEFYLYGENLYKIDFLDKGTLIYSSYTSNNAAVIDISSLPARKTFDCILISTLKSGKCGVEYVKPLDAYEENIVYQAIPDTKMVSSYTGDSTNDDNALDLPYEVQGLQAYNNGYKDGILSIELLNIHTMDLQLVDIIDEDENVVSSFSESEILPYNTNGFAYEIFELNAIFTNEYERTNALYIRYYIGDNDQLSVTQINVFPRFSEELAIQTSITTEDNLADFTFVKIDNNRVEFEGDVVVVDKPMYIPSEYTLQINEGQVIDLVNEAFIFTRNAVDFNGSLEKPIRVATSDQTGKGLFVCQAELESSISHTIFDGLNTPDAGAWILTGAVTFYESDVAIRNSSFLNNVCEDALNLVRSDFIVDQCLFENTFGDAFDADFCTGEFTSNAFVNTGNDGFDVSTSIISVDKVTFEKIGDKAISGGEKSTLTITNIEINDTIIGLASKDSTLIIGQNISIKNAEIGITLYQKKPEYTGAYIDIEDVSIKGDIGIDYLIQEDSELIIDGEIIEPKSLAKENILFDRMIQGLSITEFEEQ